MHGTWNILVRDKQKLRPNRLDQQNLTENDAPKKLQNAQKLRPYRLDQQNLTENDAPKKLRNAATRKLDPAGVS